MTEEDLLALLARISPVDPVGIDALLRTGDMPPPPPPAPPLDGAGGGDEGPAPPPSAALWPAGPEARPAIGIRITRPPADPAGLALRIATAALERGLMPVILTTLDRCGLERFGFRVERLHAATPAALARQEAELARFWALAIVIDAEDFARMG